MPSKNASGVRRVFAWSAACCYDVSGNGQSNSDDDDDDDDDSDDDEDDDDDDDDHRGKTSKRSDLVKGLIPGKWSIKENWKRRDQ